MTTEAQSPQLTWQAANQQYLLGALSNVRIALENHTARNLGEPIHAAREEKKSPWPTDIEILPALETICQAFGLTNFEREILLMAAGMELSSDFDGLFAGANNDTDKAYPTFSLALAALPGAHWSALSPSRPLRHWRLIELQQQENLTSSPLRIDERVLHYLTGVQHLDTRLVGFIETVQPLAGEDPIPIYQDHAERIKSAWAAQTDEANLPVIQLWGSDPAARRSVALEACQKMNLNLHLLRAGVLPAEPREQAALLRLWEREAIFSAGVLLFEIDEDQVEDSAFQRIINRWIESNRTPLIISAREKRSTPHKTMVTIEIPKLDTHEQKYLLEKALGDYAEPLNGEFNAIVTQFQLNPTAILGLKAEVLGRIRGSKNSSIVTDTAQFGKILWDACRAQARPRMGELAQQIKPVATWEELILPELQKKVLSEIAIQVKQRAQVYEEWGFAARNSRGLGISALFAGPSGTGKTMAAEVLSNTLQLDLYRIDLSQVVSKYIGETEKNLRKVFDAAEAGGAILLFDEADALFGKRSEVKDSHDRYANIEVSYLLQRMEEYRGLAILTSNMKSALDQAFLRRIRFVVQFPFPDSEQRQAIWENIFPGETPTNNLDFKKLARLNVTGGNIRNIALYAAFLAAESGGSVGMAHLLRAARVEFSKLEKTLTAGEIKDW